MLLDMFSAMCNHFAPDRSCHHGLQSAVAETWGWVAKRMSDHFVRNWQNLFNVKMQRSNEVLLPERNRIMFSYANSLESVSVIW